MLTDKKFAVRLRRINFVEPEQDQGKLELIATKSFAVSDNLVYIVDFLNKSLKEKRVMFGITKNKEENSMTINIYEI